VKRQQTEKAASASIDWGSQRDEWLNYLNALYAQIESFLEAYRAGSVYLNSFSGLISGISALVMKVMDPRSGTA
jgi:hypothetical protein